MVSLMLAVGIFAVAVRDAKPDDCNPAKDGFFTAVHQAGATWKPCKARLGRERTIRVVIKHASPFLYTYSAEGVALPAEGDTGPLRRLLGLEEAAASAGQQREQAGLEQLSAFVEDLALLDEARRKLIDVLMRADAFRARESTRPEDKELTDDYINRATQDGARTATGELPAKLRLTSVAMVQQALLNDFNAMGQKDQDALKAARDAAIEALPALLALYDGLRTYTQGPREVMLTYGGEGIVLARVRVTSRFSEAGINPARPTGLLDVGILYPEFKRVRFSSGLGFDVASDPVFRLEPVAGDEESFNVVGDSSASRLKVTPSLALNVLWPFPNETARWAAGISLAFGIKSTELRAIDDQTTLGLLATIGYDDIFMSLGVGSVARPVGLEGVGEDLTTSDPNALTNVRTTRTERFMMALHVAF